MKYEYYPKRRTEQERRELNEQILRLLQSEACEQAGVTDEDIFNRYTGDGGLHGLRRSDYENYNAFSAAKKELENGGAAGFSGFSYTNTKYICNTAAAVRNDRFGPAPLRHRSGSGSHLRHGKFLQFPAE